jgi:hypothetical protein
MAELVKHVLIEGHFPRWLFFGKQFCLIALGVNNVRDVNGLIDDAVIHDERPCNQSSVPWLKKYCLFCPLFSSRFWR